MVGMYGNINLKYATNALGTWTTETVENGDVGLDVSGQTKLKGQIRISNGTVEIRNFRLKQ